MKTKIVWIICFGITMGFFEAAVVVYLRALYYPDGFTFPLRLLNDYKIAVEVVREAASLIMLISVASLAAHTFWKRLAFFMIAFSVWDIFYYVFLKITLDWPRSLLDWDVLFLIPLPWIGPVMAPVSISVLMATFGILILRAVDKGHMFRPTAASYCLALLGIVIVLYSFMYDTDATLHQQMPMPYRYELLFIGNGLFVVAFMIARRHMLKRGAA